MTRRIRRFKKNIKRIKKDTKSSSIASSFKLICAKLSGIPTKEYVDKKYYKLSKKDLKTLKKIKKESKWSYSKLGKELEKAQKNGVGLFSYYNYKCWMLSPKEVKDLGETIKKWRAKQVLNKKWHVNAIMEKCKCSREVAEKKLDIAKSKKYNYFSFFVRGLYALPIKELEELPMYKKPKTRTTEINKQIVKRRSLEREEMKQEMNWNDGQFALNYLKADVNCGCTPHEFYILQLYKTPFEKQKDYVTTELWRKMYLRHCDYANTWKYFKQKDLFNKKFKKYIKRDWVNIKDLNYKKFKEFTKDKSEIFYKPIDTACGIGIKKYKIKKNNISKFITYRRIKLYKDGILEEIIKQSKIMATLNPSSVNTIRVQTFTDKGKVHFLNATVRMGASTKSDIDNFSSGGIMANVDVKTGKIITKASSKFGGSFKEHPESRVNFSTFKIPNWDKVLKMCTEAAKMVKTMPYIGWDVVINEDGSTQLIEGNHDADCVFHQYCPAITEHKGIRKTIDKYIWFDDKEKTV